MKTKHTVYLDPGDADWVLMSGGFDNFSEALRVLIYDHRRRWKNLKDGHRKRVNTLQERKRRPT
jgi:hypothetical protein